MERQIGHMVRLVDDLLDVSRITRPHPPAVEPTPLAGIVSSAVEAHRCGRSTAKQLSLELICRTAPCVLNVDPARFAQVARRTCCTTRRSSRSRAGRSARRPSRTTALHAGAWNLGCRWPTRQHRHPRRNCSLASATCSPGRKERPGRGLGIGLRAGPAPHGHGTADASRCAAPAPARARSSPCACRCRRRRRRSPCQPACRCARGDCRVVDHRSTTTTRLGDRDAG